MTATAATTTDSTTATTAATFTTTNTTTIELIIKNSRAFRLSKWQRQYLRDGVEHDFEIFVKVEENLKPNQNKVRAFRL